MKKICIIFGTRPDTIKLAPVIIELKKEIKNFKVITIATAQHRQMLDQVLDIFKIIPDYDLNIMKKKQSLSEITERTLKALDKIFLIEKPDLVIVQGDTTTTFAGSLAAFYHKIPVAHVEAGLRTNDIYNPFPEELNRRMTSVLTNLHFAPTENSKKALLKENIIPEQIFITGNTVIDALNIAVRKKYTFSNTILNDIIISKKKIVLITMHRRENWGEPMRDACLAIKELSAEFPDLQFVFPVHLNPIVRNIVNPILAAQSNIHLIEPLDYLDFVNFMSKSFLILTDSGGVQEEGPHFGIPILVLREVTERPEAVEFGTAKLVGLNKENIYKTSKALIINKNNYAQMANAVNPYGDGLASERISKIIKQYFGLYKGKIEEYIPQL